MIVTAGCPVINTISSFLIEEICSQIAMSLVACPNPIGLVKKIINCDMFGSYIK
jgi:hypothetical protein